VQGGKNNPLIAEIAPFIKTAEDNLQLALTVLSDVDRKSAYDRQIADHGAKANEGKLLDFIRFTLRDKILTPTEKNDLLAQAHELGISQERAGELIRQEMIKTESIEGEDPSAAVWGRNGGTTPVVPGSASPRLALNLTTLSLGKLRKGEECVRTFIIDNLGGGILQGTIDVSHLEWMKVSQAEIDPRRHHQEVTVRVDTSNLALGTNHVGMVEIRSNGGRQGIRVDFSIELESSAVSRYRTRLFWSGLVIGAVFGLLLYEMAPSTLTRDAIANVAFLVGFVSFVVVGAKAGKWAGGIGTFFAAVFAQPIQYASMTAYSAAAWAMVVSSFLYFFARRLLVASLAGDGRPRIWAAMTGLGIGTAIILTGVGITATVKTQLNPHAANLPVEDKLAGSSIGQPVGIRWVRAIDDRGAAFSAANSSRIEYPGLIPLEGTLEFWIKVISGYHYANSQFNANQDVAMIFSSDAQGGDVTWPGTTILTVSRSGTLSYRMATKMGDTSTMPIEARGTKFRFAEWHALGVSYGGQGEYIMLDGRIVASAPKRTQTFGQAGNHQEPLDIPTIGETVSHFWAHHRYEGGFEGILAAFRVSFKQEDWILAQGIKNGNIPTIGGFRESQPGPTPAGLGIDSLDSRTPTQQRVDCKTLSLRLYNVDDFLQASLTNAAGDTQVVLSAPERQDTGFVDISSRTQLGPNSLSLQLTNYRGGYTYGYQLRSNSTIIDEASCGNVGLVGCNNNDQELGVVFTHTFRFQCSDTSTAGVSSTDAGLSPVYRVGAGVSAPSTWNKQEPTYTEEARAAKVSGTVLLYVEVDSGGRARNIKVLRGLGFGLDERAVEAVSRWRFLPGHKDGQPVTVAAEITVDFRLL
jgi:TonB family protein